MLRLPANRLRQPERGAQELRRAGIRLKPRLFHLVALDLPRLREGGGGRGEGVTFHPGRLGFEFGEHGCATPSPVCGLGGGTLRSEQREEGGRLRMVN